MIPAMDRRRFLLTTLAAAFVAPVDAGAQQIGETSAALLPHVRSRDDAGEQIWPVLPSLA
jgi:hypothetical protein